MHPAMIKAKIHMRGMTLTALDERYGLPEKTCSDTLRTGRPNGEAAIADYLGCTLHELWPDRYDADGLRYIRRAPKAALSEFSEKIPENRICATKNQTSCA